MAASAVGRGQVVARRGLAAMSSIGLIVLGAWALRPGLDRIARPAIVAAPAEAMLVQAGRPADREMAAEAVVFPRAVVSPEAMVDPGRPNADWTTPPARVSPVDVPVQPLASLPDSADAASSTVAASGTVPPAILGLVPLPPRRPTALALRRTSPVPPKVSPPVSEVAAATEPMRADANVWSPPREPGRYRLPWGVAQLGERGNDDAARGPQWTFAVER